jgi:hypothetical protein
MTELADLLTALLHWEYLGELCVALTLFWPTMMLFTTIELWKGERHG